MTQSLGREAPSPSPFQGKRLAFALAAVSVGVFVAALDQTMVVTVLPSILRDLHIPITRLNDAAWVVTGYLLGYTVAMPLFGRIADVRGRRRMYAGALVIFIVGSVLCVLAQNLTTLVGARIVQAAGGGALVPIAMAVSADLFPPQRRAFALGIIGAAAEAGGVLGPLYGAYLAETLGWRSIFLVNVPIGILLITGCWLLLPAREDLPAAGPNGGRRPRVDYVGAALVTAGLAALTIGLSGNTQAGEAAVRPVWLVASGVAFAAFIFWEMHVAQPLVRLNLFRRLPFAAANAANLAVGAALIVGMVEIPLYAYSLLGWSEVGGGLLLMRLTAMIPVGAVLGGWLADRVGYRLTGALGFAVTSAGYFLVGLWPAEPTGGAMTRDLLLTGFGFGLVIAPISATVIASVGPAWVATGSALVTVMRMIGMMVGLSALSSWGIRRFNQLMAGHTLPLRGAGMSEADYQALVQKYEAALHAALRSVYAEFFFVAAGIALAAVIPALLFHRRRKGEARPAFLPQ